MSDSSTLSLSAVTALTIALTGMGLTYFQKKVEAYPAAVNILLISVLAYLITFGMTALNQYLICETVNLKNLALTDLVLFFTTAITTAILYFESFPLKYYLFGQFPRTDPATGKSFEAGTREYEEDMQPGLGLDSARYKLQPLTNLVTSVFPEEVVPVYWLFFISVIPLYALMKTQSAC